MSSETLVRGEPRAPTGTKVNDFSIEVATANGTGSQTANLTLLRSFFKMGIPVHGKNIFPSNIQGLPTWYSIRVSKDGYVARRPAEILVAYNRDTMAEDVAKLPPGGVCIYNADLRLNEGRSDLVYYPVPVKELLEGVDAKGKIREYIANMTYVGVVATNFGIRTTTNFPTAGTYVGNVTTNYGPQTSTSYPSTSRDWNLLCIAPGVT